MLGSALIRYRGGSYQIAKVPCLGSDKFFIASTDSKVDCQSALISLETLAVNSTWGHGSD